MNRRSLKTKIATQPTPGESKGGNRNVSFDIEGERGKLIPCILWQSMGGERGVDELVQAPVGSVITIRGFEGDSGDFVINYFCLGDDSTGAALSDTERIYSYLGGKRSAIDRCEEHRAEMLSKGFVWVTPRDEFGFYEKKERCYFEERTKRWHKKIDFCMEVLGAKRVNDEIKFLFPDGVSLHKLAEGGFSSKEYNTLLEKLLKEALRIEALDLHGHRI